VSLGARREMKPKDLPALIDEETKELLVNLVRAFNDISESLTDSRTRPISGEIERLAHAVDSSQDRTASALENIDFGSFILSVDSIATSIGDVATSNTQIAEAINNLASAVRGKSEKA
jgi:uncharacterized protein Yka (UPF0111/DUF47 family)